MQARWEKLLDHFSVPAPMARSAYGKIAQQYETGTRVYHTLGHVRDVLDSVEALASHARHLHTVQLAGWFHDAVYDSRREDNEARSAALTAQHLAAIGMAEATIGETQRLILLTKTHETAADDADGHVLLDADLAILGAPPAVYEQYARAIRREYGWLGDDAYRHGRSAVLHHFLQRNHLYYTAPMRDRREARARANLRREIQALNAASQTP